MTPCAGPPVARAGGLFWRLSGPPQPRGEVGRGRGRPCGRRVLWGHRRAPARRARPRDAPRSSRCTCGSPRPPPRCGPAQTTRRGCPRPSADTARATLCRRAATPAAPAAPLPGPASSSRLPRHAFLRGADVLTLELDGAAVLGALVIVPAALYVAVFGGIRVGSAFSMSTPSDSAPGGCSSAGPRRRFLRASLARGSPRASASRITAETDVCAASASAASAAAVAGSTVTRNCAEYQDSRLYRRCGCAILQHPILPSLTR